MITIDVTGRIPIYEQICRGICKDIAMGILKENEKIPAARVLAKELGLNPNTVAKAYSLLERDGIIYSVAGKGCFVAKHDGKADKKLTENFEIETRRALSVGVSESTLIEIVKKAASEAGGGNEE